MNQRNERTRIRSIGLDFECGRDSVSKIETIKDVEHQRKQNDNGGF